MSVDAVTAFCGIAPSYLSLLERDHGTPGLGLLLQLASLYDVSPQFIKTGELAGQDRAKRARFEVWPEIVYTVANQCVVPRLQDPDVLLSRSEVLRVAVGQAWRCQHFCEFWNWAASKDGRLVADELAGRGLIEELIERAGDPWSPISPEKWVGLADRFLMTQAKQRKHCSAVGVHRGRHACDCFEFDIQTTRELYHDFGLGAFTQDYATDLLRSAFVQKAFPHIFWSVAKRWDDRRLAGWFWYLRLPVDLFGPLVAVARSHSSPDSFETASQRFLKQATVEDMDVLLGLFTDIRSRQNSYQEQYGERPFTGGPVSFAGILEGGFGLAEIRRRTRSGLPDRLRLDLIHMEGDATLRSEVREYLATKASDVAPHSFTDDDILTVDHGGKPWPRDPRLDEQPPDRLP